MVYKYIDLIDKYGDENKARDAIKGHKIKKIGWGYYTDSKYINGIEYISKKYPKAIITSDSAFYYHNLTNRIPDETYLGTDRNATKIKDQNIKQIFYNSNMLNIGVIEMEIDHVSVKIYDKERMLCELVKNRNKIPLDYYKELTNSYRDIIEDINIYKVNEYLNNYKNGNKLFEVMQREVF